MGVEKITFRPIERWPERENPAPRRSLFGSSESATWSLLKRELAYLDAEDVVVQAYLREDQIKLDGWPRSGSRPSRPGVIVAFNSKFGPLQYATDTFDRFIDNVRGIALGLEALRAVDRYGVTKRGEQYTGWKALPAGGTSEDALARGRRLVEEYGSLRAALKATHPDAGGDSEDFRAVVAVRDA
jgi:hypothetical protein